MIVVVVHIEGGAPHHFSPHLIVAQHLRSALPRTDLANCGGEGGRWNIPAYLFLL